MADDVDIRVRLRDQRRFSADAKKTAKDVDKIGDAADRTARDARSAGAALGKLNQHGKRGIKTLVGMAAGYASISAARGAVNTTVDLAKSTLTLNKSFGLSVGLASQWAAIGKVRGADGKALTMGFKAFATQVRNARKQGGSALKPFKELGITQDELVAHGNDLQSILSLVSDGLGEMPKGTNKAAISARLFGRTWTTISPLIRDGSESMCESLALANKYGATFSGKTLADVEDLIKKQREAKLATLGLQVAFGTLIAPEITKGLTGLTDFMADIRHDAGAGADFGDMLALGLERAVPELADAAGQAAPKVAVGFVKGFATAGIWGQLITVGFLASKMGAFSVVGRIAAKRFATSFAPVAAGTVAAEMTASAGAGSLLGRMRAGGRLGAIGKIGGRLIGGGLVTGIILSAPEITRAVESALGITPGRGALGQYSGGAGWGELGRDLLDDLTLSPNRSENHRRRNAAPLPPATPMSPEQRRRNRGGDHKRASAARDLVINVPLVIDGRAVAKAVARAARIEQLAR